jgi:hypothetical protein
MVAPLQENQPSFQPAQLLRHLWTVHAPLTISMLVTLIFTLFFIVGIFADSRVITGAPAWLKPAKFGISITLYTLTITWILGFIQGRKHLVATLGWVVIGTFLLEWFAIIIQVVRGTTSHFNVATPLDGALWGMMGIAIVVLWLANFVIAGLLLFQRFDNPAFAWALRLGMMVTIVGMGLGWLMTSPTAQQMASWQAGAPTTIVGAHSVGVADGGAGLPVVGWSTQGGDLRVPHFIGMHALQLLPLLGWFIVRRRNLTSRQQTALVWTASLTYLSLTLLVTWQALRAQPVIAPDLLTIGVFAVIISAAALSTFLITRTAGARVVSSPLHR